MKRLLIVLFTILSLSTCVSSTKVKTASPQGLAVALKTSKSTILTQPKISELEQKKELSKSIENLPEDLQHEILIHTFLKQLEEGIIDFATLTPLKARRFAQQIEHQLRHATQEEVDMIMQKLLDKGQLIYFLDEIDFNKMPEELRGTIYTEIDKIELSNQQFLDAMKSIKNPELFDKLYTKLIKNSKLYCISNQIPAFVAEQNPHLSIIEYLITKKYAHPSILFVYASMGNKNPKVLIRLKELGASVHTYNFCQALKTNNNKGIVTAFLSFGFDPSEVACSSEKGPFYKPISPLYTAVVSLNAVAVEELINAGADVNAEAAYWKTPLLALFRGSDKEKFKYKDQAKIERIAQLLLQQGSSTKGVRNVIQKIKEPAIRDRFLALIKPYEPYEKKSIWPFWR